MAKQLDLGFMIGYWGAGPPRRRAASCSLEAERLGYTQRVDRRGLRHRRAHAAGLVGLADVDASSSGRRSSRCRPARRPRRRWPRSRWTTSRTAGSSSASARPGPQVVEGWYGQPYAKPLARTREYVEIIRTILAREKPVTYAGEHYTLPYPGGTGLGKAVKSITHPLPRGPADLPRGRRARRTSRSRPRSPTAGSRSTTRRRSTASTATRSPRASRRPGARRGFDDFKVAATVPVIIHDDVEEAADFLRPVLALYIGGMGAREVNFHANVFGRMGYEAEAREIQDLYLAGQEGRGRGARCRRRSSRRPRSIGPKEKIRDDLEMWRESCVTADPALRRRQHPPHHGRALPLSGGSPVTVRSSTTCSGPVSIQSRPSGSRKFSSSVRITSRRVRVDRHAEEVARDCGTTRW